MLNPNHWTTEPLLVARSRALALAFFRERISAKRWKFVKQIEHLLEAKYVQKDTWVGSEGVARFWGGLNIYMGAVFQVPSGQTSCFVWLRVHIWSDSGPFQMCMASFDQEGFQCEGLWDVSRTYYGLVTSSFSDP